MEAGGRRRRRRKMRRRRWRMHRSEMSNGLLSDGSV